MNEVLDLVSARHSLSIPYSSEENGIVERVNKEVMRYIRAFVFDESRAKRCIDIDDESVVGVTPMGRARSSDF